MTIDWMNPSEDILEARRIGFEEGLNESEEERMTFREYLGELRELIILARGETPEDEGITFECLKDDIRELLNEIERLKAMVEDLEAAMRGAYGCLEQYESTGETDRINDAMCCLALPDKKRQAWE